MRGELTKWIGIGITIITLIVSAIVWASSEHSAIEDNARNTYVSKEFSESAFAPKEDVIRIDQREKNIEKNIDNINQNLDNVEKKLDKLMSIILQGNRNDRQNN